MTKRAYCRCYGSITNRNGRWALLRRRPLAGYSPEPATRYGPPASFTTMTRSASGWQGKWPLGIRTEVLDFAAPCYDEDALPF